MQFNELPIADGTKDAIAAMGYESATPIQRDAIPHLLAGRDVIGKAQTGTGKTAAFGIPIVDALRDERKDDVVALVLVPTRELALQVSEVLVELSRGSRLLIVPIYGGTGFGAQQDALRARRPKIVVACPGRLLDLENRGMLELDGVKELVLDEADRMLDMGFIHDMRRILALLPKHRRTSLWSATVPPTVRKLASDFLKDPVEVEVESTTTATTLTVQHVVHVEKSAKTDALLALLGTERPDKAVVFTRTKHLAKRLAKRLDGSGWSSVALQGNMTQGQRERAMASFRDGKARILVATDVASRGLDVPDVTHVVNFDIPNEPDAYVHRVGRTGRNGRTGRSFTFVQSDEATELRDVERAAGIRLEKHVLVGGPVDGPDTPTAESRPSGGNTHGPGHRRQPSPRARTEPPTGGTRRGNGGGGGQANRKPSGDRDRSEGRSERGAGRGNSGGGGGGGRGHGGGRPGGRPGGRSAGRPGQGRGPGRSGGRGGPGGSGPSRSTGSGRSSGGSHSSY